MLLLLVIHGWKKGAPLLVQSLAESMRYKAASGCEQQTKATTTQPTSMRVALAVPPPSQMAMTP
jgi:hypothetical protein